jgi:hypothetical protein
VLTRRFHRDGVEPSVGLLLCAVHDGIFGPSGEASFDRKQANGLAVDDLEPLWIMPRSEKDSHLSRIHRFIFCQSET